MVTGPMPSHSKVAPGLNRSAASLRGSRRTSPRTPCGPRISATTSVSSSLVDLDVDLCAIARRHHLQKRADRLRDTATATDDLTDVALGDGQMQLDEITVELLGHDERRGIVGELLRDMLEHALHPTLAVRLRRRAHRTAGGTSASGRPLRTRIMRAVAVGRAPFFIQWRARSALMTRSAGSDRGL